MVWKTDTFSIFARGKDGAIYFETWTGSAWQPGQLEWTSLSSPQNAPARTDPVVVSWRDNRFDFYVVGSDDNLYAKAWDTDHWIPTQHDWYALSGPIGK